MGKAFIGGIALIIGLVAGAIGGASLVGGAAAGAGAGVGISTGVCATISAAKNLGYLDASQVDEVLNRAAEDLSGDKLAADDKIAGSAEACTEVMAKIKQGTGS